MKLKIFLMVILSVSFSCQQLRAADKPQDLAIRAGKIWTVTDGVVSDGVIIIKNGKIDAVGKDPRIPGNARVLDVQDKSVIPGLIDAHSHLGLSLDVFGEIDETVLPVTPDMRILDAFNPLGYDVKKALGSGVTTMLISPGHRNPIAGQVAIVKLHGNDWLLKRSAGVKFSVGNEALMSDREPTSRSGLMSLMREELDNSKEDGEGEFDPRREVLKSVVGGKTPVYIYCNTLDEITAAREIIDEYNLKAVLVGVREGDEIVQAINCPVIYTPLLSFSRDKDLKRVSAIAGAGIKLAFASFAPGTDPYDLRTSAIIAVKYGLDPVVALKSLTIDAAEILHIDERVGSIEKGKDADLVILSGDPLEPTSGVEMVIINGEIVYQRGGQ